MVDAFPDEEEEAGAVGDGVGLALSGGGYRAMVFHVGSLWRLNEVGLLPKIRRVSSVSGGSITAAALALAWPDLKFERGVARQFSLFVDQIRKMSSTNVDVGAVIGGILLPGSISDRVSDAYDDVLFQGKTLQDLPDEVLGRAPRFVFNATNVQTAALWRFSKPYMGDHRVGLFERPDTPISRVVAASSAFPPILSPMTLELAGPVVPTKGADLSRAPFTQSAFLSDGGVYDNLGLETLKTFKTILVSDAGQKIAPEEEPESDWARHSVRILDVVDNQVRSLRKRQLIRDYETKSRDGAYWGIRTDWENYKLVDDPLRCRDRDPSALARTPTRLQKMESDHFEKLVNWGYAVCDAALRAHVDNALQLKLGVEIDRPGSFPYPIGY
ncbi:NTE family protein [Bosea sp. BE271]|uniref:patatin-like phospholipase family protein n=1 Tax=Bosea TaxID=85413 RepID=UPI00285F6F32|nr:MULTISPECIES: patatin-like phospholipase family protein [Bosea]MDR6827699.1 NTE family protein [Bosea robiniae]MDR6894607.1 NTE family protein [Bosea sp. BE109]MDR7137805.1 NTE family protein [Bosea sp. BE168]MDR7174504.1 NTE family protein [Bosea sp. BE271]